MKLQEQLDCFSSIAIVETFPLSGCNTNALHVSMNIITTAMNLIEIPSTFMKLCIWTHVLHIGLASGYIRKGGILWNNKHT